jgi:nitric oxide reductase subunit B
MLMVMLDLFPAGAIQLKEVLDQGLWYARSEHFIGSNTFKTLTWLRGIGALMFYGAGVIPITWFMISRVRGLKQSDKQYFLFEEDDATLQPESAVTEEEIVFN